MIEIAIFWYRRDLRIEDNHGLFCALNSPYPVLPIFVLDTNILDLIEDKHDKRVAFIYRQLEFLNTKFQEFGSALQVFHGTPKDVFRELLEMYSVREVYVNHDYEPYAIQRDAEIQNLLSTKNIAFHSYKDQVIYEKSDVLKSDGKPYTIFTPYSKVWKAKLALESVPNYPSENYLNHLLKSNVKMISMEQIGFYSKVIFEQPVINIDTIYHYHETRNLPYLNNGTTNLSVHLRFGTVSVRKLITIAQNSNEQWLNELIWREFFMQILYHFPYVVSGCFRPAYDHIQWRNNEEEFEKWCEGKTGYPLVDAGMRELNHTGWMHNRVRMVVASFLCKHLLIDWRWGEAYFASKLIDYDLSANNGNWQWAAGTGCDAAPYFRVFNPSEQAKKFDSQSLYIEKWLSPVDLMTPPIVEHSFARHRAINTYKVTLSKNI